MITDGMGDVGGSHRGSIPKKQLNSESSKEQETQKELLSQYLDVFEQNIFKSIDMLYEGPEKLKMLLITWNMARKD